MPLRPPVFATRSEYGNHLGDVEFWAPYVREILERHRYGEHEPESGFVGTFPTFLAGDVVVKLFGWFSGWHVSFATERSVHERLAAHPEIPVPRVVAHGRLFDGAEASWPYLVSERVHGTAWRDAHLTVEQKSRIAGELGAVMRITHELDQHSGTPPDEPGYDLPHDWAAAHASEVVDRQRNRGRLDGRLLTQLPTYLAGLPDPTQQRLIHADLTRDHVFVHEGRLVGIIDWGDAMVADRYYELAALHLDLFGGNISLLRAFLAGYGWQPPADFDHRALGLTLLHQHDVLDGVATDHTSLSELAHDLFGLNR